MYKQIIATAATFGILAVLTGAFGAHALKEKLSVYELENWKTAVSYQFYHTFAILFLATMVTRNPPFLQYAYYSFTAGIILFSGSLYILSTRSLTGITATQLIGPITPLGGLLFILGWLFLLLSALKSG